MKRFKCLRTGTFYTKICMLLLYVLCLRIANQLSKTSKIIPLPNNYTALLLYYKDHQAVSAAVVSHNHFRFLHCFQVTFSTHLPSLCTLSLNANITNDQRNHHYSNYVFTLLFRKYN